MVMSAVVSVLVVAVVTVVALVAVVAVVAAVTVVMVVTVVAVLAAEAVVVGAEVEADVVAAADSDRQEPTMSYASCRLTTLERMQRVCSSKLSSKRSLPQPPMTLFVCLNHAATDFHPYSAA